MTDISLHQRCRDAEEAAQDWERRALQAEAAYQQLRQRMLAAEAIAHDAVTQACHCAGCARKLARVREDA